MFGIFVLIGVDGMVVCFVGVGVLSDEGSGNLVLMRLDRVFGRSSNFGGLTVGT